MFKGHLIRRYGNRKLYSITESRYITLPEIAEKFLDCSGFIIRDVKTDEDLTIKYLVKALASAGHFDEQIKVRNLRQIEANLEEQGISIHG
tara:strand:- start:3105 stop:3377 length:273 start_codon:yes stop_codon:yes gene_type:complete